MHGPLHKCMYAQPFVQLLLKLIINYVQLLEYKNV